MAPPSPDGPPASYPSTASLPPPSHPPLPYHLQAGHPQEPGRRARLPVTAAGGRSSPRRWLGGGRHGRRPSGRWPGASSAGVQPELLLQAAMSPSSCRRPPLLPAAAGHLHNKLLPQVTLLRNELEAAYVIAVSGACHWSPRRRHGYKPVVVSLAGRMVPLHAIPTH